MVKVSIELPVSDFKELCNFLESEESNIAYDEEGKGELAGLFKAIYEVLPKPEIRNVR
jgi:hypothetical protein